MMIFLFLLLLLTTTTTTTTPFSTMARKNSIHGTITSLASSVGWGTWGSM
jgi:hypothetical protein